MTPAAPLPTAVHLLQRALNFLPDNSSVEADVRRFLWAHAPTWSESYEVGRASEAGSQMWEGE